MAVDQTSLLRQEGNSGIIMGALIVLAGLLMAITPVLTFLSLTALIAALLVVAGACALVDVFRRNAVERKLLDSLFALISIGLAAFIFFNPISSAIGLTIWIAAWLILRGVVEIAALFTSPIGRGLIALDAIVNIALGIILLSVNPVESQAILGFYVAISLIFWGFSLIYRSSLIKKLGS